VRRTPRTPSRRNGIEAAGVVEAEVREHDVSYVVPVVAARTRLRDGGLLEARPQPEIVAQWRWAGGAPNLRLKRWLAPNLLFALLCVTFVGFLRALPPRLGRAFLRSAAPAKGRARRPVATLMGSRLPRPRGISL
jgi:hypothetical protein